MERYKDELISNVKKMLEIIEETSQIESEIDEEVKKSIHDKFCPVFGIDVPFEYTTLFEDAAKIKIPKSFYPRSEDEIKEVYFIGEPPKLVLSDGILPFMIAFNPTRTKQLDNEIQEFGKVAKAIINRVGSKSKILGEQYLKRDNGNIFLLETLMQTLDGVSYNLFFFTSVEEFLWIGTVSFDSKYSKRLVSVAKEIVSTFETLATREE
ncbi:MAG: hypothetical protein R3Y58_10420 [Eubacteriales bacterium]